MENNTQNDADNSAKDAVKEKNITSEAPTVETKKITILEDFKISCLNPWATALALFFGWGTFFAACSGFSNKWSVSLPIFRLVLGSNVGLVTTTIVASLVAIALSVLAILTFKKIGNDDSVKKTWGKISNIFLVVTAIYAIDMLAIIIYSLLAIGVKSIQGQLWLSNFLSTVIMGAGSAAIAVMAKMVTKGKTDLMKIICIIAVVVAVAAFVISFAQVLSAFYGRGGYSQAYEIYDMLR